MRIVIYKDKELFEKIKKLENSKLSFALLNSIKESDFDNKLIIINYNELKNLKRKTEGKIFLLYSPTKNLKNTIKHLKRGAIDIIAEDFSDKEIEETIKNAAESFTLYKNKVLNKELEKIGEIARGLFSSYNLNDSLNNILEYIKNYVKSERVFISIIKKQREKIIATVGDEINTLKKEYSKIRNHEWLKIINKEKNYVYFKKGEIETLKNIHKEDFIKFPLTLKDKLIGIITIDNKYKLLPKNINTEFLKMVALLLSVHIENYKIYTEAIKAREELRKREEREFLQKLTMSLNHEINNPLTIAYLNLESLKRKLNNPQNIEKNLSGLEISLERIKGIMDNINKLESEKFIKSMKKREFIDFRYEA